MAREARSLRLCLCMFQYIVYYVLRKVRIWTIPESLCAKWEFPNWQTEWEFLLCAVQFRNCSCAKWESGQSENRIFVICFAGKIDMEQRFPNFYKVSSIACSPSRVGLSLISWDEGGVNGIMAGGQGTNSNFSVFWVLRCQNRRGKSLVY